MCCGDSRACAVRVMRDVMRVYICARSRKTDLFSTDLHALDLERSRLDLAVSKILLLSSAWWSLIQFWRFCSRWWLSRFFFLKTVCCMIQTVCLWSWICLLTAVSVIQWQREDLRDDPSKIFQNCFVDLSFRVSSLAISKKWLSLSTIWKIQIILWFLKMKCCPRHFCSWTKTRSVLLGRVF